MKSVFVLSDTHGNRRAIDNLTPIMAESDYIIHLGDTSQDGNYIRTRFPDKTYVINGNCDLMKSGENEIVLTVENVNIFACHGHLFSVKSTLERLAARAAELDCKLALYGHTHRAAERDVNGVKTVNPGTLSRYSENSYAYIVINGDKIVVKTVFTNQRNL